VLYFVKPEAGRIPALRADRTYLCELAAVEAALLERLRQAPAVPTTPTPAGGTPPGGPGGGPAGGKRRCF
jgi:hypothetical protein